MLRSARLLQPGLNFPEGEPGIDPGMEMQQKKWLRPEEGRNPVTIQRFQQKLEGLSVTELRNWGKEALFQKLVPEEGSFTRAVTKAESMIQKMGRKELMNLILHGQQVPGEGV